MRRWFNKRRSPRKWSDDEIESLVLNAYVGKAHGLDAAAVVVHMPEDWMPKKIVSQIRSEVGRWQPFNWWGFVWDDYRWGCVGMGDHPIDLWAAFYPHYELEPAQREAQAWLTDPQETTFSGLPAPAHYMTLFAVRRGPGEFM